MPSIRSAAVAAAALLLLLAGCDSNPPAPQPSASATPYTPTAGTCFNYETQRGPQDDVPCAGVHHFEVAYVGQVTDASDTPPLSDSAATRAAYRKCSAEADKYLGGATQALMVNIDIGLPSLAAWQAGARWFSCDLAKESMERQADESGEESVSGSVKNAYTNPSSTVRIPCFTVTERADGVIGDWKPVSCTTKHTVEMAGLISSASTAGSPPQKHEQKVLDACYRLIAAYTKVSEKSLRKHGVHSITVYPRYTEWELGERAVRCDIYLPKGGVSRSLAGAGSSAL